MKLPRLLVGFLLISNLIFGQQKVQYSKDFTFQNGLYITFDDFKNNNPVPVTHILSDYDIRDSDYLEQVLQHDSVFYYDNLFEERSVAVQDLWGFCQQNRVFIGFGAESSIDNPEFFDFYPLINIGAVSFFTAYELYYSTMSPGPNMGVGIGGGMYDPMFDNTMTVTETGQVQLLLDFKTGKILLAKRGEMGHVPEELVMQILRDDPVIFEEYKALAPREQKQMGMFYIRKFNDRNPIYFPAE